MSSDGKDPQDEQSREPGIDSEQERQQPEGAVSREDSVPVTEEPEKYSYEYEDEEPPQEEPEETTALTKPEPETAVKTPPPPPPPPIAPPEDEEEDEEDEEMSRMSFLDHLEELRTRIVRVLIGVVVIYLAALAFADKLFAVFYWPFQASFPGEKLVQLKPTEMFYIEYVKLPMLAAIFIGAPWIMLQVWGFIAPGLYKRERRMAGPFIVTTALLFVAGGMFCYYVALPLALGFLLHLSDDAGVEPGIQLTEYYDMFFNLHVGMGVVFQMPVVIFFFTLLRITSPAFLLRNGRYAILIIFIAAAIITPTPDVTTMLTFAAPMVLLYYAGIGASYLVVLRRENRKFPWGILILVLIGLLLIVAAIAAFMVVEMNYQLVPYWPFLIPPVA